MLAVVKLLCQPKSWKAQPDWSRSGFLTQFFFYFYCRFLPSQTLKENSKVKNQKAKIKVKIQK